MTLHIATLFMAAIVAGSTCFAEVIAPGFDMTVSGTGAAYVRINQMAFKSDNPLQLFMTRGYPWNGKVTRYVYDPDTGLLAQPTDIFSIASIGDGYDCALGIGFHGADIWLTRVKYGSNEGKLTRLRDVDGDGSYDTAQDFVLGLRTGETIGQIAVRGDELFFGVGAIDNTGSPSSSYPYSGTIIRVPDVRQATVTDMGAESYLDAAPGNFLDTTATDGRPHLYASGFRNPFGIDIDTRGWLWVADNGANAGTNEDGEPFPETYDLLYRDVGIDSRGIFPPDGQPGGGGATMMPWSVIGSHYGPAGVAALANGSAVVSFANGWLPPYRNSVGLFSPDGVMLTDSLMSGFGTPGDYPVAIIGDANDRILVAAWEGSAVYSLVVSEPPSSGLLIAAVAIGFFVSIGEPASMSGARLRLPRL